MNEKLFAELVESVKQAGKYKKGKGRPSRVFEHPDPDVKSIREAANVSQSEFALLIGVSLRTLQNWEQRRSRPNGAARALLRVVAANPRAAIRALHQ